jgi:hypothetical protein
VPHVVIAQMKTHQGCGQIQIVMNPNCDASQPQAFRPRHEGGGLLATSAVSHLCNVSIKWTEVLGSYGRNSVAFFCLRHALNCGKSAAGGTRFQPRSSSSRIDSSTKAREYWKSIIISAVLKFM